MLANVYYINVKTNELNCTTVDIPNGDYTHSFDDLKDNTKKLVSGEIVSISLLDDVDGIVQCYI